MENKGWSHKCKVQSPSNHWQQSGRCQTPDRYRCVVPLVGVQAVSWIFYLTWTASDLEMVPAGHHFSGSAQVPTTCRLVSLVLHHKELKLESQDSSREV